MKFTTVPLIKIDKGDERFRISWDECPDSLQAALRETGMVNPPLLIERNRSLIILSGWKRVEAAEAVDLTPLPVFITEEPDDLVAFRIPIYENLTVRTYNQIEKATIIQKCLGFGAVESELIRSILPLLGIPPTRRHLDLYKTVSGFDADVKDVAISKDISMIVLEHLTEFSPQERLLVLPFLRTFGRNKQKEFLTLLREISRKEQRSFAAVLASQEIQSVCDDPNTSFLQKANTVLDLLKERRLPTVAAWVKTVQNILKDLEISEGIVINPAPFFEGEEFDLHFRFKNREELLQRLGEMKNLVSRPEFTNLWKSSSDD